MTIQEADVLKVIAKTEQQIRAGNIKQGQWWPADDTGVWVFRTLDDDYLICKADAVSIQGKGLAAITPTNGQYLMFNSTSDSWTPVDIASYPFEVLENSTGSIDPEIFIDYDSTTRKITLSDNGTHIVGMLWRGVPVPGIVDGYISPAHDIPSGQEAFFLYYNGTTVAWYPDVWKFTDAPIAMVYRDGANFCLREFHSASRNPDTHKEFHETIGTYLDPGVPGGFTGYVLESETATDRRPLISEHKVWDEENPTTLPALTTNEYSWSIISGANTTTLTTNNTEIVGEGVNNRFEWNEFTGGVWTTTQSSDKEHGKIFVMGVPVTRDTECQKMRYVLIPPQQVSKQLSVVEEISPGSLELGSISGALQEYVFIGEFIIKSSQNNWEILQVNQITGSRLNQVSRPATSLQSLNDVITIDPVATEIPTFDNGLKSGETGQENATAGAADGGVVPNYAGLKVADTFNITGGTSVSVTSQTSHANSAFVSVGRRVSLSTTITTASTLFTVPSGYYPYATIHGFMLNASTDVIYGLSIGSNGAANPFPADIPAGDYRITLSYPRV